MDVPTKPTGLKLNIGWDRFYNDTLALAWKLKGKGPFIGIVAISRGGLIPAGILAYELDIKYVDTYCLSSYDYQTQREAVRLKPSLQWNDKNILVVDDLVDTGATFSYIKKEWLSNCHYASLYAKPSGRKTVDTFLTEVSQDTWICFPWD